MLCLTLKKMMQLMNKKICFNFASSKSPFEVIISNSKNIVLARKTICGNYLSFCVCTSWKNIKVIARHENVSILKQFNLNNCPCQKLDVSIDFPSRICHRQMFRLCDACYNLPVSNAILTFTKKQKL